MSFASSVGIGLRSLVKHSFLKRAVAKRTARSRYSVLYVLIYIGEGLFSVVDRMFLNAHPSTDSGMALMRYFRIKTPRRALERCEQRNDLFETRMG